jgi:hypothetical protein
MVFHQLFADVVMKSGNEELDLEVGAECFLGIHPILLADIVSSNCLWHHIWFTGHASLECFDVLGEVDIDAFSRLLGLVSSIRTYSLGRVLWFEGPEEAGFDVTTCPC